MKILFVTPSEISSGEAITALHTASLIIENGGFAAFVASEFTGGFLKKSLPQAEVFTLTEDLGTNRKLWNRALTDFDPDAIIFADFAITFFSSGAPPLADEAWLAQLVKTGPALFSFDHLGYGQGGMTLRFGSLDQYSLEKIQPPPKEMQLLLPCPIQEPGGVQGRSGHPFCYWRAPEPNEAIRARFCKENELLIFHSVPTWAWKFAESLELPLYAFYTQILVEHLRSVDRPISLVSVNSGNLLQASTHPNIRVQNLSILPPSDYEQLIVSADLMLTENCLSVTLGKAVCGQTPAVALKNSLTREEFSDAAPRIKPIIEDMELLRLGAFYPHEVFPIWRKEEVETLGVFKKNRFTEAFLHLELYGEETGPALSKLLLQKPMHLLEKQEDYSRATSALPDAHTLLASLL